MASAFATTLAHMSSTLALLLLVCFGGVKLYMHTSWCRRCRRRRRRRRRCLTTPTTTMMVMMMCACACVFASEADRIEMKERRVGTKAPPSPPAPTAHLCAFQYPLPRISLKCNLKYYMTCRQVY